MRIRDFDFTIDTSIIDDIFKKQPDLGIPSLKNVVDTAIVENSSEKVVAYGVIKLFAEGVLILDQDIRKREKAEAVIRMLKRAIKISRSGGIEQLYVISNDEGYTRCLEKRFGFKKASGQALFLELSDG